MKINSANLAIRKPEATELKIKRFSAISHLSQLWVPIGLGFFLGIVALWRSPLIVLGALIAILLIIILLKRPELGLLGLLVVTSTIFAETSIPRVSAGVGRFYITDFVLMAFLGLIVLRWLIDPKFKIVRTSFDLPLLIFYGAALLSTCIAILHSTLTFKESLDELRVINSYLTFFIITNLIKEKRQLTVFLRGLFFLAILVAMAMIAQYLLGESVHILAGRVEKLTTSGKSYEGITRILPPGEPLLMIAFMITTIILIIDKFKAISLWGLLKWSLLGLALILTFRRSVWMVIGLEMIILVYLIKGQDKLRFIGWGLAVVIITSAILVSAFSEPRSKAAKVTKAFLERVETLFDTKTYEAEKTSTLRWRDFEYKYAVPQITSHPFFGLGLGAMYRPLLSEFDYEDFDGRRFTHNGHLYVMLKSGLFGYLALLWLSFVFLRHGFKYWRHIRDLHLKASVLGITLAYLGAFISAVSEPRFMDWNWTPVLGIMLGINEVIFMQSTKEQPGDLQSDSNLPTRRVE